MCVWVYDQTDIIIYIIFNQTRKYSGFIIQVSSAYNTFFVELG